MLLDIILFILSIFFSLVSIALVIFIIPIIFYIIKKLLFFINSRIRTKDIIYEERTMKIISKEDINSISESKKSNSYLVFNGMFFTPINYELSKDYNVVLSSKNATVKIYNEWIYKKYKEGDYVNILIEIRKDKYGNIITKEILGAKEEYQD